MPRCECGKCRYCRNRAAGKRFYDRNREAIIRRNVEERRARINAHRNRPDEDLDREARRWLDSLSL